MTNKEPKKFSIEENLKELEAIVQSLQSGDLSMEESLKQFEAGVKKIREGQKYLEEAEAKLIELGKESDS